MSNVQPFDPGRHLSRVNGSEYLEVKWRLVWLRDDAPESQLETELVDHAPGDGALFRCTITRIIGGEVKGRATGYGSESSKDFGDYLEKAESKAIGRALAHLGYGTQFVPETELSRGRVVDAPVQRGRNSSRANQAAAEFDWTAFWAWARERNLPTAAAVEERIRRSATGLTPIELRDLILAAEGHPGEGQNQEPAMTGDPDAPSQRQQRYLQAVAREAGFDPQALDALALREYGALAMALNKRDTSALIDLIQNQQAEVPLAN